MKLALDILMWGASLSLMAMVVILVIMDVPSADWQMLLPLFLLAGAALLIFPPLWWSHYGRRIQRYRLVAAAIFVALVYLIPTGTINVEVQLPSPAAKR